MKVDPQIASMRVLASSTEVVTMFAESDCAKVIVFMLDNLIDNYKLDLMNVKPEGLERLQASIQQSMAIRDVVANETRSIPKI